MKSKSEYRTVKEKQKANSDERVSDKRVSVKRQSKRIVNVEDKQQMRKGCKRSDNTS